MDLKTYLSPMTAEKRDEFARRCGTTKGHLQNVMYGSKTLDAKACVLVEAESGGEVTRIDLRPADWHDIWPELVAAAHNATLPTDDAAAMGEESVLYQGEPVVFLSAERNPIKISVSDPHAPPPPPARDPSTPGESAGGAPAPAPVSLSQDPE